MVAPLPTRGTAICGYPRGASYGTVSEQLHNSYPVKYGYATCLSHKDGGTPLNALPKTQKASLSALSAKQGSCEYHFLKSFGMTELRN